MLRAEYEGQKNGGPAQCGLSALLAIVATNELCNGPADYGGPIVTEFKKHLELSTSSGPLNYHQKLGLFRQYNA